MSASDDELSGRLSAALEAAGDVAYSWDLDGDRLDWWGGSAPAGLEFAAELTTGRSFANRIHPDDLVHRQLALAAHFDGEGAVRLRIPAARRRGRLCLGARARPGEARWRGPAAGHARRHPRRRRPQGAADAARAAGELRRADRPFQQEPAARGGRPDHCRQSAPAEPGRLHVGRHRQHDDDRTRCSATRRPIPC